MRKIVYIDVGNIPPNEVEHFMDNCIRKIKGLPPLPKLTRYQRIKKWFVDFFKYGDFTALGGVDLS